MEAMKNFTIIGDCTPIITDKGRVETVPLIPIFPAGVWSKNINLYINTRNPSEIKRGLTLLYTLYAYNKIRGINIYTPDNEGKFHLGWDWLPEDVQEKVTEATYNLFKT